MEHTYMVDAHNNVVIDGIYVIKTNESYGYFERERQAYNIIDSILDNEVEMLIKYGITA